MRHFDAIIIGTGQAGPPLAARFSDAGKTVAIIERHKFGGTCVNTGCIPTKTMVASAYAAHVARRRFRGGQLLDHQMFRSTELLYDNCAQRTPQVPLSVQVYISIPTGPGRLCGPSLSD